jgi:CRISPR-associated protein Cas5t
MEAYRVKISSWTSSFRYPNIISGFQPTLEVPPISTVLGLINAASGSYIDFSDEQIGYYFEYDIKGVDLETIYQVERHKTQGYPQNRTKSNVINREFLFDCKLFLYLQNEELIEYLKNPYYSLVLGRSGDLASVDEITKVELTEIQNASKVKGQVIPFNGNYLPGEIQALPRYFTNSIPRNNLGTEAFSVISCKNGNLQSQLTAYSDRIDGDKEIHVYMHHLNFK